MITLPSPPSPKRNKLALYLTMSLHIILIVNPCDFWREHEHQYPTLVSIVRDIFTIPASGAGVERLFNSARDVCHYRRGRLNETAI
ncbi:uncharacterized protein N7496_008245 [Penicillium cataractarum]|uniref:HAT C-terminal dimerisation domain-containing protein n=1 Tax=Penicillium cataractarum TaxID=2100454 RepID=A0A9W9V6R6_9EURO|nr:uncharacterized protein N7496_008245 [Penicillium cataractarum]KAJ5368485.1 hypothetical protein N7496_008245 [Penicillium cataractarum]